VLHPGIASRLPLVNVFVPVVLAGIELVPVAVCEVVGTLDAGGVDTGGLDTGGAVSVPVIEVGSCVGEAVVPPGVLGRAAVDVAVVEQAEERASETSAVPPMTTPASLRKSLRDRLGLSNLSVSTHSPQKLTA
jgi:hypothetical protein